MMRARIVVCGATLAVAAMIAVPVAQAAVPPIKAFPKFFLNGAKATRTVRPVVAYGKILLHTQIIGNMDCENLVTADTFNSTENLSEKFTTEKGFFDPPAS